MTPDEDARQKRLTQAYEAYPRSRGVPPEGYICGITDNLETIEEVGAGAWHRKRGTERWIATDSFRGAQ